MFKKLGAIFAVASLILLLTACKNSDESSAYNEEDKDNEASTTTNANEDIDAAGDKVGDTYEIDGGTAKVLAINKKETTAMAGPMEVTIKKVRAAIANDQVPFIELEIETKNTSDDVIQFYPEGKLATSTGVQIDRPSSDESDDLLGTYVGEVNSSGSVFYILDNKEDLENLDWIRLLIVGPRNDKTAALVAEDLDLKIELQH
ncbi:hypothetical protein [Bacillus atrophaeus]|uniref:hypothetical protein n=1 Tax=Bacillus atrophaeus TaxID=1452 RepID=UPI002DBE28A9|nr:hypothetical protein [Bacillus atrophaeus]MEC0935464.1 hypothetical protein [Bacillus atrophaeus]